MSEMRYPWLEPMWQTWKANLTSGRLSNAGLLVAPHGLGAEALTEHFSKALMCSNFEAEPCGFCHSCQLMASESHPDYHRIQPEQPGKNITVDQIRQCNRFAQESSQLSGYRLIVVEPADAMNEAAANALLKTLESPARQCVFLLVAAKANRLLPTIVSRCQQWHLTAPSAELVSDWLKHNLNQPVPEYVAYINDNAPLATQAFVEQGWVEAYQEVERHFCQALGTPGFDVFALAKLLTEAPLIRLRWVWFLLVDAQKRHFGLTESHATPGSEVLAQQVGYNVLYQHTQSLSQLLEQLDTHSGLNAELLIMNWLIKLNEDACS